MTEWLHPMELRNEQTGQHYTTSRLTIDEGSAPALVRSLLNIQKDKHRPKVYAKEPHILTHSVDAVRGFCTEYEAIARKPEPKQLYRDRHLEEADVETMTEASF